MRTDVNQAARIALLIHSASGMFRSERQMALAIGYSATEVNDWKVGRRACPVEAQALMAQVAGLDPVEVLAYAVIERHANTPRGEKLLTALGKVSGITSGRPLAALLCISGSAALVSEWLLHTMYTNVKRVCAIRTTVRPVF